MNLGSKEITMVHLGSKEITRVHLGSKEIYVNIAPDAVAFSATIVPTAAGSYHYGLSESSRTIDETLFSEVTTPVNNLMTGGTSPNTKTITQKAYTPTAKALNKYKCALVTVTNFTINGYGTATASIGGNTLPNCTADGTIRTTTLKLELNDSTNISTYVYNPSSYSGYFTTSNVAITKIVLTNSEE